MIQQKLSCNYPTPQFAITNWHNIKTEFATACAKHANVKAEVTTGKTEIASACAKHANVKAEVTTGKTEVKSLALAKKL
ncbi:MAG: hypothetical protein KAF91_29290 [Nostoc sp. TH1S01]|nr:hypothetical protein [Nostoc sp. TH1S01]